MFTVAVSVTYVCTAQNLEEYIFTHELTSSLTNAGINSINVQEHCLPMFTFLLALMRNQFAGMQSSRCACFSYQSFERLSFLSLQDLP